MQGDAIIVCVRLFDQADGFEPVIAIDKKAAIIATIYTTIPGLVIRVGLYFLWGPMLGFESFGFCLLGG